VTTNTQRPIGYIADGRLRCPRCTHDIYDNDEHPDELRQSNGYPAQPLFAGTNLPHPDLLVCDSCGDTLQDEDSDYRTLGDCDCCFACNRCGAIVPASETIAHDRNHDDAELVAVAKLNAGEATNGEIICPRGDADCPECNDPEQSTCGPLGEGYEHDEPPELDELPIQLHDYGDYSVNVEVIGDRDPGLDANYFVTLYRVIELPFSVSANSPERAIRAAEQALIDEGFFTGAANIDFEANVPYPPHVEEDK
jgi:hypothetical protein